MPQPEGLQPGVYVGLSMDAYHKDPAIGSSGIKNLLVSPELYWINSPLNPDREAFDTASFRVGRAYHSMVLEPEKDFPFAIKETHNGKPCKSTSVEGMIGRGDYDMLLRMYARLLRVPRHWNALHGGISESSIFWRDKDTGLMCKVRPDNFAAEWIVDLKTTTDVSDKNLRYDFPKYGYHISGTMYSEGMQALKGMVRAGYTMPPEFDGDFMRRFMEREKQMFCFVFQEKQAQNGRPTPFTTRLWNMTPYASEIGHEKFVKGLAIYHDNMHNLAPWPSGYPDVEDITEDMVSASISY